MVPGILQPGPLNAITDVAGVRVGHVTVVEGDDVRTGATAILPHGDNLFQHKVPAGMAVGNGFGKLMGSTQIAELGEIETPILLTNTLAVPRAADAILDWTLAQPGNEAVLSVNAVVGETNDGYLNNIRRRVLTAAQIMDAIKLRQDGMVAEGCVGAGTGTVAFGWKGGIGTSSRRLPVDARWIHRWRAGAVELWRGVADSRAIPVGRRLGRYYLKDVLDRGDADGSIMIVLATDAPLSDRNLDAAREPRYGRTRSHRCRVQQRFGRLRARIFDASGVRRPSSAAPPSSIYPICPTNWYRRCFWQQSKRPKKRSTTRCVWRRR